MQGSERRRVGGRRERRGEAGIHSKKFSLTHGLVHCGAHHGPEAIQRGRGDVAAERIGGERQLEVPHSVDPGVFCHVQDVFANVLLALHTLRAQGRAEKLEVTNTGAAEKPLQRWGTKEQDSIRVHVAADTSPIHVAAAQANERTAHLIRKVCTVEHDTYHTCKRPSSTFLNGNDFDIEFVDKKM